MSTANEALTTTWEKIADDTDYFMISVIGESPVEAAFQTTDTPPSTDPEVTGHPLLRREGLIRTDSGTNCPPGFVYLRVKESSVASSVAYDVWT